MVSATALPEVLRAVVKQPSGARFHKCALQVNPFAYIQRHNKTTVFATEEDYNAAMVTACKENGIEVIAITDHYRVNSSRSLATAAQAAGIAVFRGFEAVTKDGVHVLCLFEPTLEFETIDRYIGDCGIHDDTERSPVGQHDVHELLDKCKAWGGVCVAAHVASAGGLLEVLRGTTAIKAWQHPELLACSLPGAVKEAPDRYRPILENVNPEYSRERTIAVINSQDVSDPAGFGDQGSACWVKMSDTTVDGLRQAFLDPDSRVRLRSDPEPQEHTELVAVAWEGGFLDGVSIHFNENLNVLIGGRGTGKSTIVESVRYVLGLPPLGVEAARLHEEFVKNVLKNGTKISLLVRSHRPTRHEYTIERTVPNPAVVKDSAGNVKALVPSDVAVGTEVFGQHELSELSKSPEKLTRLLARFVKHDPELDQRERSLNRDLRDSRTAISRLRQEIADDAEQLAELPALRESLKRFQEAGIEAKLKERSELVKEESLLGGADRKLEPLRALLRDLEEQLPIDTTTLSEEALKALPGGPTLARAKVALDDLNTELASVAKRLETALETAAVGLASVRTEWNARRDAVEQAYQKIVRELQSAVDAQEFVRIRTRIEELTPLEARKVELEAQFQKQAEQRRTQLASWADVHTDVFRELEAAAKTVNKELVGRVKVAVAFGGNATALDDHLRAGLKGVRKETIEALRARGPVSVRELADTCRAGKDALRDKYNLQPSQAQLLAESTPDFLMQLDELHLPTTTDIQLNVGAEGGDPVWKSLGDLSTGQKATAVLLLLLLESPGPLVVDQPEDDLDNRFISEGVVPKIREEKRRRQFVFATHNANIPVLGDAELIVGLRAEAGRARIPSEHVGSIDSRPVREIVEETLEGGKDAFEMRRLKYGF